MQVYRLVKARYADDLRDPQGANVMVDAGTAKAYQRYTLQIQSHWQHLSCWFTYTAARF
jgi:hypothetical protein